MYQFEGTLFATRAALINEVCFSWLTAGGSNSLQYAREQLTEYGAEGLVDEMMEADVAGRWFGDEVAEQHGVEREEWIEAMGSLDLSDHDLGRAF